MLETVTLEKVKVCAIHRMSNEQVALMNLRLDQSDHASFMADQLALRLSGYVHAMHEEPIRIEYPRDWWQAFRQRWFPAWWLNKYPVQMTKVEEKRFGRVCPHLLTDDRGAHFNFLVGVPPHA